MAGPSVFAGSRALAWRNCNMRRETHHPNQVSVHETLRSSPRSHYRHDCDSRVAIRRQARMNRLLISTEFVRSMRLPEKLNMSNKYNPIHAAAYGIVAGFILFAVQV